MNVLVVGTGFWGTAIAMRLRRHHDVLTIDSREGRSGSGAAQGLARLDWLRSATLGRVIPSWWSRAHDEAAEAHLVGLGPLGVTERVTTWANPGLKERPGMLLLDPSKARSAPDFALRVTKVESSKLGARVETDGNPGSWMADRVVLALGAWTDHILRRSGLQPLGVDVLSGSTAIVTGLPMNGSSVLTHIWAPYRHVSARTWGKECALVGASMAKGLDDQEQYEAMLARARGIWPGLEVVTRLQGYRPVGPGGQAYVGEVAPNVIAATGGARIGLVLAGGIARRVEELIS